MVQSINDTLSSEITIYISGRNLKNLDLFTKSDPKCEVFEFVGDRWTSLGKTEVKNNNLNPDFAKSFNLKYYFEKIQKLKFVMWDHDD